MLAMGPYDPNASFDFALRALSTHARLQISMIQGDQGLTLCSPAEKILMQTVSTM